VTSINLSFRDAKVTEKLDLFTHCLKFVDIEHNYRTSSVLRQYQRPP